MLIISSREFRANQKNYFDKVDSGQEVLVQRGKNKSYRIVPVTEFDTLLSKDNILEPDLELARAIPFEEFKKKALDHIKELRNDRG